MRIRRRKNTFNANSFIKLFYDAFKLAPMHIFTIVLSNISFKSCLLGWTMGCTNIDFPSINFDLVPGYKKPRIHLHDLYKGLQASLLYNKSLFNFTGHKPAHSIPDILIYFDSRIVTKFIFRLQKPESVRTTKPIEETLKVSERLSFIKTK